MLLASFIYSNASYFIKSSCVCVVAVLCEPRICVKSEKQPVFSFVTKCFLAHPREFFQEFNDRTGRI